MNHAPPSSLHALRSSLSHYWRINISVMMAIAILTTVLTGALLVGDSMRGSLRDLTLDRLGRIQYALLSSHFFRESIAAPHTPAIVISGSATNTKSKSRASQINIYGVDDRFNQLFPSASLHFRTGSTGLAINESLQEELHAEIGDTLLLSITKQTDIHRETVLGSRDSDDVVQLLRLTVTQILPDRGIGRFGLRAHQSLPLNAYVPLTSLQKSLHQQNRINGLFMTRSDPGFLQRLQLQDLGIKVRDFEDFVSVESSEIILNPALVRNIESVAKSSQLRYQRILTYLANTIVSNSRMIPYSTVTAVDSNDLPSLSEDEIALNEWAAEDLQAKIGDRVDLTYYTIGAANQLTTQHSSFRLKAIVKIEGLAADRNLTPDFPGIHDVEHISEWSPPFPIDLKLIRPKDEEYWNRYRATPKAFLSEAAGVRLWSNRFGSYTSVRVYSRDRINFVRALRKSIDPAQMGFVMTPVREQGLKAAAGATDFGMLFLGFSFFLMISSALLVALLFRLAIQQRAFELGLLLSIGYTKSSVRRRFSQEGIVIAAIGAVPGLLLALAYAWLMIAGLRTWWNAAVGSTFLFLHVEWQSLLIGSLVSLLVTIGTIAWSVRAISKFTATTLLSGSTTLLDTARPGGRAMFVSLGFFAVAIPLVLFAFRNPSAEFFFGAAVCLLVAGLSLFAYWLRSSRAHFTTFSGMAARNNSRAPGRSILSTALVACASFVIVTVAANRQDPQTTGAGGFSLVAESDIPIYQNLNRPETRSELGISESPSTGIAQSQIHAFRLLPGDDVSCLNLYQPQSPRLLGVPAGFQKHARFEFQQKNASWNLLEKDIAPDVIPAIGDANSVRWILHLGIGQDFLMQDDFGKTIRLRFVALLQSSIFQSELLISEANFVKHFPSRSGYSYFLISTPAEKQDAVAKLLENALDRYGFDATRTDEKLASFLAVENTYLSTFQTLGGLGLLLGTLGLAIVLIRNVLERRGELAMMRAIGYRRSTLTWMVIAENAFLLIVGILIGTISALIPLLPHHLQESTQLPWPSLGLILLLILVTGMTAGIFAVRAALRIPLLPALKAE